MLLPLNIILIWNVFDFCFGFLKMKDHALFFINGIFLNMSLYKKKIDEMCVNKYNLSNILDNDFDAIAWRISFIQDREPTSMYVSPRTLTLFKTYTITNPGWKSPDIWIIKYSYLQSTFNQSTKMH